MFVLCTDYRQVSVQVRENIGNIYSDISNFEELRGEILAQEWRRRPRDLGALSRREWLGTPDIPGRRRVTLDRLATAIWTRRLSGPSASTSGPRTPSGTLSIWMLRVDCLGLRVVRVASPPTRSREITCKESMRNSKICA